MPYRQDEGFGTSVLLRVFVINRSLKRATFVEFTAAFVGMVGCSAWGMRVIGQDIEQVVKLGVFLESIELN